MTGNEPADGGETELQLLRSQNEQLEARLRDARETADQRLIHVELKAEALKAGMVDLDGLKLIEPSDVVVDDNGNVRGATSVIARMRREKPWLFPAQSSSSTAAVPAHTGGVAKLATEMSLDEWRAARAELLRRR